jgi:undecaprenyl phosphate N,N'-diacetylbacillosamine 1-phosphate transferase
MIKRIFDILVSLAVLTVLLVPMLAIALLIRIGSPGNPLFCQRRAGRRGKPFTILKFRTMRADADPYGSSPHSGDDPRLTRLGKLLRETSLDELPQVLNVIIGHMSLVGPRPLYERQAAEWNDVQRRRLEVRPGVTGYAQAYGRGQLTIEEKIEMDVHYVDNRSFWFDLRIILRTAGNILRPGGEVYEKQYSNDKEYENDQ